MTWCYRAYRRKKEISVGRSAQGINCFLYMNIDQTKTCIKETVPCIAASVKIRHLEEEYL